MTLRPKRFIFILQATNVIEGNVIANNRDMGIRLNAFTDSIVRNNIVYNSDSGIAVQDKKGPSQNNLIENNVVYALHPEQLGLVLTNDTNHATRLRRDDMR